MILNNKEGIIYAIINYHFGNDVFKTKQLVNIVIKLHIYGGKTPACSMNVTLQTLRKKNILVNLENGKWQKRDITNENKENYVRTGCLDNYNLKCDKNLKNFIRRQYKNEISTTATIVDDYAHCYSGITPPCTLNLNLQILKKHGFVEKIERGKWRCIDLQ